VEATERSISPVITISVSGSAMMATSPTLRQMKKRFVECRKYGDTSAPKTTVPTISRTSIASQRTAARSGCRPGDSVAGTSSCGWKPRSDTRPPPRAERRRHAHGDEAVEGDRGDQQAARERLAPERRDVHHHERAVDRVQQQRAERGAEHGAAAAEDRHAADHDGGDHLELVADAGDRVDGAVQREPERPSEPGDRPAQDEREEHAPPHRDAGEPRG